MNSKEALETLGNVEVAVTTIRSGITHFKTLKEQYETEFEVLERELFIRKELKDFDVYQRQLEKLEKENELLKLDNQDLHNQIKKNVKEHYKEFMEDYDCLLEEYHELYKVWEKLKKVIEILKYKLEIAPYHNKILEIYSVDFLRFDPPVSFNSNKKEYELLKEVLDND